MKLIRCVFLIVFLQMASAYADMDTEIDYCELEGEYDDLGRIFWLKSTSGDEEIFYRGMIDDEWGATNLFKTRSAHYETGSIDLADLGIGFINGISTSLKEAKSHAERLSTYGQGVKVHYIYNATHRAAVDVMECVLGHCGVSTPPVRLLRRMWKKFFETHSPSAVFLQICHSQGAIAVKNALESCSSSLRKRVIVLAIAPGVIIPKKLCLETYHYSSKNDFVPGLDFIGKAKRGSQLIQLKPHRDASGWDHAFDSPTYQDVIKNAILHHIEIAGSGRGF